MSTGSENDGNDPCAACGYSGLLPATLVADLTIASSFPSQNQLGANAKGAAGWHYRRLRQDFAAALHNALLGANVPRATGKRRIWLRRIYRPGKRPYDVANLYGGSKHIVDVLVNRGILKDDSPKYFEGIYSQQPGPADAIHLRIFDL
jgi:hypothetical protein